MAAANSGSEKVCAARSPVGREPSAPWQRGHADLGTPTLSGRQALQAVARWHNRPPAQSLDGTLAAVERQCVGTSGGRIPCAGRWEGAVNAAGRCGRDPVYPSVSGTKTGCGVGGPSGESGSRCSAGVGPSSRARMVSMKNCSSDCMRSSSTSATSASARS